MYDPRATQWKESKDYPAFSGKLAIFPPGIDFYETDASVLLMPASLSKWGSRALHFAVIEAQSD